MLATPLNNLYFQFILKIAHFQGRVLFPRLNQNIGGKGRPKTEKRSKRYKRQHKRLGLGIASLSTSFVFLLISNTKRVKNYFKLKGKHEILVKNKGAKNAILTSLSQRGYNS